MSSDNIVYVSIQLTRPEKAALDNAVKRSGLNRNRFIRSWIANLALQAQNVTTETADHEF